MYQNPSKDRILVQLSERLVQLPRAVKVSVMVIIDMVAVAVASAMGLYLRLSTWDIFDQRLINILALSVVLFVPLFSAMGVYRSVNRFTGIRSIMAMARAFAVYMALLAALLAVARFPNIPRTIAVIQPIIFLLLAGGARLAIRFLLVDVLRRQRYTGHRKRVIIYGAGIAGQQLVQLLRREPHFEVLAFIDDDKRLHKQKMDGIPVYHAERLNDLVNRLGATDLMIAISSLTRSRRSEIISELHALPVNVQTLPHMGHLVDGQLSINDLREINIEDLLGRDPVQPNELLMGRTIAGKTVLVSGAGGSIGSELCRQILAAHPARLILAEMSEFALYAIHQELVEAAFEQGIENIDIVAEMGNLFDVATVRRLFARHKPDTVFHAAAYKHVPLVEANVIAGLKNNIFSTLAAAREAEANGVSNFILISTDKAVRPTNMMGASKRCCELVLQALAARGSKTKFAMVRFGNVLGSSGSVVPRFEKQIKEGGPVTLTHKDITRYFMTIPEASQLVIQAGAMAKGGEVYVLDMGKSVKIIDLARAMIRLSGLTEKTAADPSGDIAIEEVGLRPGEKLYEELLIGENPATTKHPRIMTATEHMIPWDTLSAKLDILATHLEAGNAEQARAIICELVPEYAPPAHHVAESQSA